jgi:hypothetical protein
MSSVGRACIVRVAARDDRSAPLFAAVSDQIAGPSIFAATADNSGYETEIRPLDSRRPDAHGRTHTVCVFAWRDADACQRLSGACSLGQRIVRVNGQRRIAQPA